MTDRCRPEELPTPPVAAGKAGDTSNEYDARAARGETRPAGAVDTSVAIFLFSALALNLPSGYSLGALLLLATGVIYLAGRRPFTIAPQERPLSLLFAFYFAVCAASLAWHDGRASELDVPLRFLLAIPVFIVLRAKPPAEAALWGGLAIGAIGGGVYAGWQFAMLGIARPGGHTNPIQFSNLCVVFAMLCLAGLSWAQGQHRARAWTALLVVAAACGLAGSMMSGSRGSWLAVPVCMAILFAFSRRDTRPLQLAAMVGGALLVVLAAVSFQGLGLERRLQDTVSEANGYFTSGSAHNSVGGRLEMWRTGLLISSEKPVLGWGSEGYRQRKAELVAAGLADPYVMDHSHAHNEYIDAVVKRGALGLAALLALYLVPLRFFARAMRRSGHDPVRPYALAGILLIACYVTFGLTQAFLTHNNGAMTLAFLVSALWAFVERGRRTAPTINQKAG